MLLEGDRNIVGKASVVFEGMLLFLGIFLEVYFVASSREKTRDELVEGDPQELDNAGERRADDGARRRCRQSWTVVRPARRRRASAHLRSLARVRVEGKSRVIPYQILVIVVVDGGGERDENSGTAFGGSL